MKNARLLLLAASTALLPFADPFVRAEENPSSPAGEKLYLALDYDDPIAFDRARYAFTTGDELILATLKSAAAEQARVAGYAGEIVVLGEKAKAPAGAAVLTLNWATRDVTADFSDGGHHKYLGVVSNRPLSYHPDHHRLQLAIDTAGLRDARRDAAVRVGVEMNLYVALHYLVDYQQSAAPRPRAG